MGNGELIDILQLIAKAYASRYGRNLNIGEGLKATHKVEERGLTLHGGGDGYNHLFDGSREQLIALPLNL